MFAQSSLSTISSPLYAPGEASCRLWETLKNIRQIGDVAEPGEAADRLPLSLRGRCLTPDGLHVVCEAVAVSSHGLTVACEAGVQPDERIIAHFRGLGEIEGVVARQDDGWFVLDLREPPERVAVLSQRLLVTLRRQIEGAPERRLSERIDQKLRKTVLKSKDGRETAGEMMDLSTTGAAVRLGAAAPYFWVGQEISVDGRSGRIRRHFPGGVGIAFDGPQAVDAPF